MADFGGIRAKSTEKKSDPHPDCAANVAEFERLIKNAWLPYIKTEVLAEEKQSFGGYKISDTVLESIWDPQEEKHVLTKRIKEFKNVTFVWGKKFVFKHARPISFHQSKTDFIDELIGVLNMIKREV
jgi:Cft2 family RNA processing exonuclease